MEVIHYNISYHNYTLHEKMVQGGAGAVSGQTEIVICVSDELEWS